MRLTSRLTVGQGVAYTSTGQKEWTTPGTYTWYVPAGVTSISVVAVGGGQAGGVGYNNNSTGYGGAGGWLVYRNSYAVTPGMGLQINVGQGGLGTIDGGAHSANGQSSTVYTLLDGDPYLTVIGALGGGQAGPWGDNSGQMIQNRGGYGGGGGLSGSTVYTGGGGGAGGYAGAGGNGAIVGAGSLPYPGYLSGGGAGGAGGYSGGTGNAGAGGGVGIYGQGSDGTPYSQVGHGGGGGSGGTDGVGSTPGLYGGGAGGAQSTVSFSGGQGAVRIIWPGNRRTFPTTNTQNR